MYVIIYIYIYRGDRCDANCVAPLAYLKIWRRLREASNNRRNGERRKSKICAAVYAAAQYGNYIIVFTVIIFV